MPCCASFLLLPSAKRAVEEVVVIGPRLALPRLSLRCRVSLCAAGSAFDPYAHGPGGPGDDLLGHLDGPRVEVGHLGLRDLTDLGAGDAADLGLVRLAAALAHTGGLLDQLRRRRRLGDELE